MTDNLIRKLKCLFLGHSWGGGVYHFDETHRYDYDLRFCGRCCRDYVVVE